MPNRDYHQERREYEYTELTRDSLHGNPFEQFNAWMDEAMRAHIMDPTAMSVATVDSQGQPHSRIVLLKEIDETGYVFYSHYDSHKGVEISHNPLAALLFFWPQMDRQIRIEGRLEKVSRQQSEDYFHSRPRDSQIAAASSNQSQVVAGRKTLEQNFALKGEEYQLTDIPCPEHWGGYRLVPSQFEFWQGRANRLHDRFIYFIDEHQHWDIERLSP
ncbi:pyridoxamine 5'-phosphate oxidase [Thiomicrorhabdus sediminis]|uniref:Pyridoxine/pyridoxamine 5'-phosphate oxidase n=1 Tax=Thiomicrorhabdus sediminis TaxID=2580412 RepID=A0A4P9K5G8_9GAMM|nr:pyridoxamine 5'-phosphate oxidase [Thiomicrorhabdus sediminis]QCU89487.1 pyridoxamine 5'-phosphate oxidase [Thiomicrorhabdus sediminis]